MATSNNYAGIERPGDLIQEYALSLRKEHSIYDSTYIQSSAGPGVTSTISFTPAPNAYSHGGQSRAQPAASSVDDTSCDYSGASYLGPSSSVINFQPPEYAQLKEHAIYRSAGPPPPASLATAASSSGADEDDMLPGNPDYVENNYRTLDAHVIYASGMGSPEYAAMSDESVATTARRGPAPPTMRRSESLPPAPPRRHSYVNLRDEAGMRAPYDEPGYLEGNEIYSEPNAPLATPTPGVEDAYMKFATLTKNTNESVL